MMLVNSTSGGGLLLVIEFLFIEFIAHISFQSSPGQQTDKQFKSKNQAKAFSFVCKLL